MAVKARQFVVAAIGFTVAGINSSLAAAQTLGPASIITRVAADIPDSIVSQRSKPHTLDALMTDQKIPAVSVAVFRDGRLAWSHAWGFGDANLRTPATSETLFQAASISKPVTALAAMTMVADGSLSLDGDISKSITGWQVDSPITVRQLLSHSAGLGLSGFQGYEINKPLPSVLQILNGEAPANSPAVGLEGQPGTAFNYSGGGFTVLQALMIKTSGKPFDLLMQERVLGPLGMTESRFSQPLPANLLAIAAKGHQGGNPIIGGAHVYPELAAAGLWTTPRDLGKVAVSVQNAVRGSTSGILTPPAARQMLTPQIGGYGLGFGLATLAGEPIFSHRGLNEGFETYLVANAPTSGPSTVIVVMTNGQGGSNLASGVVRAVAREYGWRAFAPREIVQATVSQRQLASYEGLYQNGDDKIALEMLNGVLYARDGNWQRAPLIAMASSSNQRRFAVQNRTVDIALSPANARNDPVRMTLIDGDKTKLLTTNARPFSSLQNQTPLLRGTMNEWGTQAAFLKTGPYTWTLDLQLAQGEHNFKIATNDWSALNLGASLGAPHLALGQSQRLAPMGDNLAMTLPQAGVIRFEIDTHDERRAVLRVTLQGGVASGR